MKRSVVSGICELVSAPTDSNGFVNRRPSVQPRSPAQDSEKSVTAGKKLGRASFERGHSAALAAGRRPIDFQQFGAIDRAVLAEVGRYQLLRRKGAADRRRLRAVLVPYFQLGGAA